MVALRLPHLATVAAEHSRITLSITATTGTHTTAAHTIHIASSGKAVRRMADPRPGSRRIPPRRLPGFTAQSISTSKSQETIGAAPAGAHRSRPLPVGQDAASP